MTTHLSHCTILLATLVTSLTSAVGYAANPQLSGELKQWHKVTLTFDGPTCDENDTSPNPFMDYRLTVTFRHESGTPSYRVPGYFAADGQAADSSATHGHKWRVHLCPDSVGTWHWSASFVGGRGVAIDDMASGERLPIIDGLSGSFRIEATDKQFPDYRALGRLEYVGKHYLRFAGTGDYFLKMGPDSPETLLAYADFDGTEPGRKKSARPNEALMSQTLKTWQPHIRDWMPGDPTWKGDKGKGLIGAINYLSAKGANSISFIPYNAGGDGDNVWPFNARNAKFHYDCSKLDQWGIVFDHAQAKGLFLHFKLQEQENDDDRIGDKRTPGVVPEALDGGRLGPERKLYLRELIARFGYHLALNWNLGEENTQSPDEQRDMAKYIVSMDPYPHPVVVHTFPHQQDQGYLPLLGRDSSIHGASLQNSWNSAHQRTLKWLKESAKAGQPWVVCNDEQGPASLGVPPDEGYAGFNGIALDAKETSKEGYTAHDIRKFTLWGTLTAGGGGVEYYFGYALPQNDLVCEDFRSRDRSWDYGRIALAFFREHRIPIIEMTNADELIGNPNNDNTRYCLAKPGHIYVVYLPHGGPSDLDLSRVTGQFQVDWYDPRRGGPLRQGEVTTLTAGGVRSLGRPPAEPSQDWVALIRKTAN